jgi:hypothetical protein
MALGYEPPTQIENPRRFRLFDSDTFTLSMGSDAFLTEVPFLHGGESGLRALN